MILASGARGPRFADFPGIEEICEFFTTSGHLTHTPNRAQCKLGFPTFVLIMPVEDDTNPVLKQRSGVLDFAIGRLRPTSLC